jgi:hypothetical protein
MKNTIEEKRNILAKKYDFICNKISNEENNYNDNDNDNDNYDNINDYNNNNNSFNIKNKVK